MVNNMTDLTAQEPAWQTRDHLDDPVIGELRNRFGPDAFTVQATRTGVPVVWIKREQLLEVGDFLKKLPKPYVMLFDLHGMDERLRTHREGLPAADFSGPHDTCRKWVIRVSICCSVRSFGGGVVSG